MKPFVQFGAYLLLAGCSQELPTPSATSSGSIRFKDVTSASGLTFLHNAGLTAEKHLPETMGAGAALCDFNEDGYLDLYLVQSGLLPEAANAPGTFTNELWLGDGQGGFRNASASSADGAHAGYGMGVSTGDFDADGHLDLYITNLGPDVLLKGDGEGSFRDVTAKAQISDLRWTAGSTFFDADGDGDLDLYVTGYVDYDLKTSVYCGDHKPGWRSYCHPDRFPGIVDRFWRNMGNGTFEDQTTAAGLEDSRGKGLGVCASDFDADGDLDLYIANDSVENRLWINDGKGKFSDGTLLSGTGVNGLGLTEAGMGIASGDFDGNGLIDIYVTNFDDESNTFYKNDGDGFFTDTTATSGLEAASRMPVGFGTIACDLDGDGDLDLAVANGHIIDNIHLYNDAKTWAQKTLLFKNDGRGHFSDVSSQAGDFGAKAFVGRGLYAGDIDRDGDLDLILTENNGQARIFRNESASQECIELWGLPQGARVVFKLADGSSAVREAGPATSYFGASGSEARYCGNQVIAIKVSPPGKPASSITNTNGISAGRYRAETVQGKLRLAPLE
ncbi:MAG: hypothetical protein ACI8X5_003553 [Planctomycetota bacterium]